MKTLVDGLSRKIMTRGRKAQTSIKMARSTTRLVTYPRTRPMTPLATEDDPMSTSICIIQKITLKVYFFIDVIYWTI
jgi:hypothetical protein